MFSQIIACRCIDQNVQKRKFSPEVGLHARRRTKQSTMLEFKIEDWTSSEILWNSCLNLTNWRFCFHHFVSFFGDKVCTHLEHHVFLPENFTTKSHAQRWRLIKETLCHETENSIGTKICRQRWQKFVRPFSDNQWNRITSFYLLSPANLPK